jgi:hypothetical protein
LSGVPGEHHIAIVLMLNTMVPDHSWGWRMGIFGMVAMVDILFCEYLCLWKTPQSLDVT